MSRRPSNIKRAARTLMLDNPGMTYTQARAQVVAAQAQLLTDQPHPTATVAVTQAAAPAPTPGFNPTARATLDEDAARAWIATRDEVRDTWNPVRDLDSYEIDILVYDAQDAGVLILPPNMTVFWRETGSNEDPTYEWLLDVGTVGSPRLASLSQDYWRLLDDDVTGVDAAIAILREAVENANDLLDTLQNWLTRIGAVAETTDDDSDHGNDDDVLVCEHCGGVDVRQDAYVDVNDPDSVIATFDDFVCNDCSGVTTPITRREYLARSAGN